MLHTSYPGMNFLHMYAIARYENRSLNSWEGYFLPSIVLLSFWYSKRVAERQNRSLWRDEKTYCWIIVVITIATSSLFHVYGVSKNIVVPLRGTNLAILQLKLVRRDSAFNNNTTLEGLSLGECSSLDILFRYKSKNLVRACVRACAKLHFENLIVS